MLGLGTASLEFEEPDLASALPDTATTALITGALLAGFKLLPPPQVNHEDVLVHPQATRLQQFRDLTRAAMRRVIVFHFLHGQRLMVRLGERPGQRNEIGVRAFRTRWETDPAFRKAWQAEPRFAAWHDALREKLLAKGGRVIAAQEGKRLALARTPNFGGSAHTSAAFAEMMDRGSVF